MTASVDQDRVRATWILCETLLDHLPQARQSSSTLGNLAGLAAGRLVPCGRCGAKGRVTALGHQCAKCVPRTAPSRPSASEIHHFGCSPCLQCDGTGWRKRRAGDGDWDEYAGVELAPVPTGLVNEVKQALALEKERPELRDVALRRADRVLGELTGVTVEEDWAAAWRRKTGAGSYAELAFALERLRDTDTGRYRAVWRFVVLDEPVELGDATRAFVNESMVVLASMLPERIRVPRWLQPQAENHARKESLWRGQTPAHARQRAERDAEMRRLRFEEGWKIKRLCRHFGLAEAQVKRIVSPAAVPSGPAA
jgi:hypothetical protein